MNEYNIFSRIATIVGKKGLPVTHELYTIKQEHADLLHKLKQKYYRLFK